MDCCKLQLDAFGKHRAADKTLEGLEGSMKIRQRFGFSSSISLVH